MGSKKVFIVEDEYIITMLVERMMERLGYEVVGSSDSGEEALAKIKEQRPDLLLMDIQLNGELDGIETVAQIHKTFDVPVIFISGNTDKLYDGKLQTVNYIDFLSKPIQQTQLKRALQKIKI